MIWEDIKVMSGLALRCKEPELVREAKVLQAISTWILLRAPTPELSEQPEREVVGALTEVVETGDPVQAPHALYRLGQVYERRPETQSDQQFESHQATALQYYERAAQWEGPWAEKAASRADAIRDPRVVLLTLYFENPVTGDRVAADDAAIAATLQKMGRADLVGSPYFASPTENGYQVQIFNHL